MSGQAWISTHTYLVVVLDASMFFQMNLISGQSGVKGGRRLLDIGQGPLKGNLKNQVDMKEALVILLYLPFQSPRSRWVGSLLWSGPCHCWGRPLPLESCHFQA